MPITKPFVSLIGMGSGRTVITWNARASDIDHRSGHQVGTFYSASVAVEADYFCASHITFEVRTCVRARLRALPALNSVCSPLRDPRAELRAGGAAGGRGAAGGGAAAVRRQDDAVQVQDPGDAGHAVRQHRPPLPLQLRDTGLHRLHFREREVPVPGT